MKKMVPPTFLWGALRSERLSSYALLMLSWYSEVKYPEGQPVFCLELGCACCVEK